MSSAPRARSERYDDPRAVAIRVVRTLREAGHVAYLAGGCVRDELLGIEPKDYDVATDARPDRVRELFTRTNAVGASFGVVLVRERGATIEVATFRTDGPYSDARRPDSVEYATPEEDAKRRDFTINALFLDPLEKDESKRVIDFVGGRDDLAAKVIRAVGDPEARLAEDHLRALRAVRFACRYGFEIEQGTKDAIRAHASDLRGVSRERIGDEIRRMMAHSSRAQAAGVLEELTLDRAVFDDEPPQSVHSILEALSRDEQAVDGSHVPIGVPTALAAWLVDRCGIGAIDLEHARTLAASWRGALMLSNDETAALVGTLSGAGVFMRTWDELPASTRKRAASGPHAEESLRLLAAIDAAHWTRIRDEIAQLASDGIGLAPDPFMTGETLIEAGFRPGPGFSTLLDRVYDAQLEGHVRTQAEAIHLAGDLAVGVGVERAEGHS